MPAAGPGGSGPTCPTVDALLWTNFTMPTTSSHAGQVRSMLATSSECNSNRIPVVKTIDGPISQRVRQRGQVQGFSRDWRVPTRR